MWMYQGKGHMWTAHPLSNPWDHCLCVVRTMKDVTGIDKIKTAESLVNDLHPHRQWSPNMIVVYFLSMIDGDYLVACWVVGIMQIWALCWKMRAHISPFTFGKDDKGGKPIEILLTSMVIHLTSIEPCLQRVFQQCNISQCCLGFGLKLMTVIISLFFRLGCSDSSPPENLACRGLFDGLKLMTTIISLFLSLCLGLNLPSNGNFWIPYEKNISST